jgi:hypothetical protein
MCLCTDLVWESTNKDLGSEFDHPVAGELSGTAGHLKLVVFLRFKKAS